MEPIKSLENKKSSIENYKIITEIVKNMGEEISLDFQIGQRQTVEKLLVVMFSI